jgi:hypothetical protein
MLFKEFSNTCEKLEGISGRLEMIDLISTVLPNLAPEELPIFVRFVMGRIFPDWSAQKLGIGPNLLYEAIGYVAGIKKEQVIEKINRTGDVGQAVEELLMEKSMTTFFHEELDLVRVYHELVGIAEMEGKNPSGKNCSPSAGCWVMPTLLKAGISHGSCSKSSASVSEKEACGKRLQKHFLWTLPLSNMPRRP